MKTRAQKPKPKPCPCDDPGSKTWQRQACRKKGCTKDAFRKGGRPKDMVRSLQERQKEWNRKHREKLLEAGSSTASTAVCGATPGTSARRAAKILKGSLQPLTNRKKAKATACVYTTAPTDGYTHTEGQICGCWRCVSEEEVRVIPPYPHHEECPYSGTET